MTTKKEELERELLSLRSNLTCPLTRIKPHIFDLNNNEDINQQIISMLTEEERKMINRYFELMVWAHPDLDMAKLSADCMMILRNLFKYPSYSTTNTDGRNYKKRSKFMITFCVSMKFLRSLDII